MVSESPLESTEHGLVPKGKGWFVLNAREAAWIDRKGRGFYCEFEGEADFSQLGINLRVLAPGEPMAMYHRENDQEDFLVLAGEALLIIEGDERPLRQWDFVHCPAGTDHVFVGAGEGPCAVLMIGSRREDRVHYPVNPVAAKYDASVNTATDDPEQAYADWRQEQWQRTANPWPLSRD